MCGLRILSAGEVEQILESLGPEPALESQRRVFIEFSTARSSPSAVSPAPIQSPLRTPIWTENIKFLFMPARAAQLGGTAAKIISGSTKGAPLKASTVVMDEITGEIRGILNAAKLTPLRNACGSLLSFQTLKLPEPRNLLIFGTGAQALSHADLFLGTYPSIRNCTFISRRRTARSEALTSHVASAFPGVQVDSLTSDGEDQQNTQVNAADIIITATSSTIPLFDSTHVRPGTHLIMIGSCRPDMHEVDTALIKRARTIIVDSKEACGHEAGELIDACVEEDEMVELGELLQRNMNWEKGDLTVFTSVGIGLQDVAIATLVLDEAEKLGLGTVIQDYN